MNTATAARSALRPLEPDRRDRRPRRRQHRRRHRPAPRRRVGRRLAARPGRHRGARLSAHAGGASRLVAGDGQSHRRDAGRHRFARPIWRCFASPTRTRSRRRRSATPPASRPGHVAIAVGRSGEGDTIASAGLVNRAGGPWQTWLGGPIDRLIRLDGGIYDGLSGAPVADASGAVIGTATSALSRSYGIVVPAATVSRVVDALLAHGRVGRAWLGIGAQTVPVPGAAPAPAARRRLTRASTRAACSSPRSHRAGRPSVPAC